MKKTTKFYPRITNKRCENSQTKKVCSEEYSSLRAELVSKQDRKIEVYLHMYLLYIPIFALAVEFEQYNLLLITYMVLIPYQAIINNMEWNVSRISAYIRIFYESEQVNQKWETMNTEYKPYTDYLEKTKIKSVSGFVRRAGSVHLAALSTGFYVFRVLENAAKATGIQYKLSGMQIGLICLSVVAFFIVLLENRACESECESDLLDIMHGYKRECDESSELTDAKGKRYK